MTNGSYFKIPNNIFLLGLKPNELMIYTYMLSINRYKNNRLFDSLVVKYKTIAKECNISVATAVNTIKSLCSKDVIKKINRYSKYDGGKIANCYCINHINGIDNQLLHKNYFKVYREDMKNVIKYGKSVFSVYLLMLNTKGKNCSYPSLTTIQNKCVISSRMLVIDCIKKLEDTKTIKKFKRKSKFHKGYITNKYTHIKTIKVIGKIYKSVVLFIMKDDSVIFTIIFFFLFIKNIYIPKTKTKAINYINFP